MRRCLSLLILALLGPAVVAGPDTAGDPLPEGALARMGSARWRHGTAVGFVAFLPDGKTVLSVSADGVVHLWDRATGKEQRSFATETSTMSTRTARTLTSVLRGSIALTPDGKRLVIDGRTGGIKVWDVATGKSVLEIEPGRGSEGFERVTRSSGGMVISPDGKLLATADRTGCVRLTDLATGKVVKTLGEAPRTPDRGFFALSSRNPLFFSPDGKTIGQHGADLDENSGEIKYHIRLWDIAAGKERFRLNPPADSFTLLSPTFAPDGKTLAWADTAGTIHLVDPSTGKERSTVKTGTTRLTYLAYSPDGKTIYGLGMRGPEVRAWDAATGKVRFGPPADEARPPAPVGFPAARLAQSTALAISADGKWVAWGEGNLAVVADAVTGKRASAGGHRAGLSTVQFLDGGKTLLTVGTDRDMRRWDAATGKETGVVTLPADAYSFAISADGKVLAVESRDGGIRVQELATDKELRKFDSPMNGRGLALSQLALSPDGKLLAVRPRLGTGLRVLSVETGKTVVAQGNEGEDPLRGRLPRAQSHLLLFSPDSRVFVAGIEDQLYFWETATGRELRRLPLAKLNGAVIDGVFSPDGRMLAVDHEDSVSLWETATGELRATLGKQQRRPDPEDARLERPIWTSTALATAALGKSLAFSPDGRLLVRAEGNAALAWDVLAGKKAGSLTGHVGKVAAVAFAPDGKTLATGSGDATALVWDVRNLKQAAAEQAPKDEELPGLWDALRSTDARKAWEAVRALTAAPGPAVALVKEQLKPAPPVDEARIEQLVKDLDARRFAVRKEAEEELEKLGPLAAEAFRKVLAGNPPLDTRKRLQDLLDRATTVSLSNDALRQWRAVELLERLATPAAREHLQALAKGASGALATEQAKAALSRLP